MSEFNEAGPDRVDAAEPYAPDTGPDFGSELSIDAPEADAVEQRSAVLADEDGLDLAQPIPFDADEADAADQWRVVELDEDDYDR